MCRFLRVRWYLCKQWWADRRFYTNNGFRRIDRDLKKAYRFKNPYTMSRKFLTKKGETDVHLYGETDLTTYERIGQALALNEKDRLLELGSGRGRGAFFLHCRFHAQVHGIEWVPEFVGIAQRVASRYCPGMISFSCEDFIHAHFEGYTAIYLYGTSMKDIDIEKLVARLKQLPATVRIITVSYPLTDYSPDFHVQQEISASFAWGTTSLFIQNTINNTD